MRIFYLVIIFIFFAACNRSAETSAEAFEIEPPLEEAMNAFNEFFEGERIVLNNYDFEILTENFDKYTFFDVNGDGVFELILQGQRLNILSYENGELVAVFSDARVAFANSFVNGGHVKSVARESIVYYGFDENFGLSALLEIAVRGNTYSVTSDEGTREISEDEFNELILFISDDSEIEWHDFPIGLTGGILHRMNNAIERFYSDIPSREITAPNYSRAMREYNAFLVGARSVSDNRSNEVYPGRLGRLGKYTFFDVNGDGVPELIYAESAYTYVISYRNGRLYMMFQRAGVYGQYFFVNDGYLHYSYNGQSNNDINITHGYFGFNGSGEAVRIFEVNAYARYDSAIGDYHGNLDRYPFVFTYTDSMGSRRITREEFDECASFISDNSEIEWYSLSSSSPTEPHELSELIQTGEFVTTAQMERLRARALRHQDIYLPTTGLVVAIEPSDGSEQQVYISGGIGYQRIRIQSPYEAQIWIINAHWSASSGERALYFLFITEDSEWVESFHNYWNIGENDEYYEVWFNITEDQYYYTNAELMLMRRNLWHFDVSALCECGEHYITDSLRQPTPPLNILEVPEMLQMTPQYFPVLDYDEYWDDFNTAVINDFVRSRHPERVHVITNDPEDIPPTPFILW
ncbi:MAG: hypothetical protein LBI27_09040, partial [Clostridiales bacterium]|nr:hypothetical protein [Clostridiales bacterium]